MRAKGFMDPDRNTEQKLRVLIADDEPVARTKLRRFLSQETDVEIVGEAGDGHGVVRAVLRQSPDVMFLDIQMPELDGFGVLNELGSSRPQCIIFVTAYDRFAVRAFEEHAVEYLLKPYDQDRFNKALRRAREVVRNSRLSTERYPAVLLNFLRQHLDQQPVSDKIAIKSGRRIILIRYKDIDWIEAADNYVVLHTKAGKHIVRETMTSLEQRLQKMRFVRISRSTIVNLERIQDLEPLFYGDYSVRLLDGTKLTCSRSYRSHLREFLAD